MVGAGVRDAQRGPNDLLILKFDDREADPKEVVLELLLEIFLQKVSQSEVDNHIGVWYPAGPRCPVGPDLCNAGRILVNVTEFIEIR